MLIAFKALKALGGLQAPYSLGFRVRKTSNLRQKTSNLRQKTSNLRGDLGLYAVCQPRIHWLARVLL